MQPMRVLQHEQLSPQAYQIAATYQLGTPQEEFKVTANRTTITSGIVCIIVGVIFAFVALSSMVGSSDGTSDPSAAIVFLPITLIFVLIGLFYLLYPLFYRSWHVYVCSEGMIYTHGSKVDIFPWNGVQALWERVVNYYRYGFRARTTRKYTIQRNDGYKAVITQRFAHVESLSERINQELMNRLYPQIVASYNAGNAITFGPLTLSTQGINNGRALLPWFQVEDVTVNRGYVNVRQAGGGWRNWASPMASNIPNLVLFLALVRYAKQGQAIR